MNIFYSGHKELRSGWKILRLFVFVIVLSALFALAGSLLRIVAIGDYAVHLAMIAGVLVELWLNRKPLSYIGLDLKDTGLWKDFGAGLVWGSLSIGLVAGGMAFITKEIIADQLGQGAGIAGLFPLLFFWLIVAVAEESLFRGYVLSALTGRVNTKVALVISAGLFTAIHLINPNYYWFAFVYAFLLAMMFGGIVLRRGNLGAAIGFHFMWNLLQDKGWLNMPERGGEIIFAVVLLINLVLVYCCPVNRQTPEKTAI